MNLSRRGFVFGSIATSVLVSLWEVDLAKAAVKVGDSPEDKKLLIIIRKSLLVNDLSDASVIGNKITFGDVNTTSILPADDNGVDLGSANKSFKDAHVQGTIHGW